jgi:DNA-binding GntR family transcriptional regulator
MHLIRQFRTLSTECRPRGDSVATASYGRHHNGAKDMERGRNNPGLTAFFDALIEGRLRLGQTLTQDELGSVIGLSLSKMREVTVLLEAEGLIDVRKKRGLTIFYPDVKFVGGTFQYREILEREGLRRFVEMADEGWIKRMRHDHEAIIAFVQANPDPQIYRLPVKDLEAAFHGSLINALGNEQITVNYRRNSQKMYLLRLLNPDAVGAKNTIKSMQEHQAIIGAIAGRDEAAAVEALQRHLHGVLHRILTH